jgi:hypothetical protein
MADSDANRIKFEAMRNAMYHAWRKTYLDRWNRLFSFLVIIAGAAAAADMGKRIGLSTELLAFIAALAGSMQLVFDFGGMAREHDFLQRQYYDLIAQMAEEQNQTEVMIAKLQRDLYRIYANEPAPLRALDAIAYNATAEALGFSNRRIRIRWYHTIFSQCVPFNQSEFPYATPESA